MVVVVQGLHPSVASFHGEAAGEAFGGEQLVPVGLAVRVAILQEEGPVAKDLAALAAGEALRMEVLANGIQTVTLLEDKYIYDEGCLKGFQYVRNPP